MGLFEKVFYWIVEQNNCLKTLLEASDYFFKLLIYSDKYEVLFPTEIMIIITAKRQ